MKPTTPCTVPLAAICLVTSITASAVADELPSAASVEAESDTSAWDELSANDKGAVVGLGLSTVLFGTAVFSYYYSGSRDDDAGFRAYRDGYGSFRTGHCLLDSA